MGNDIVSRSLFDDVRNILSSARQKAYSNTNFLMVEAYWQIGQRIVQEEQAGKERAEYGRVIIRALSRQLGDEFGKGLSASNLWNFRRFYQAFPSVEQLYTLRRELTWSHYRLIMRVENPAARAYYVQEAAEQVWSTRQLDRNITTLYYERLLKAPDIKADDAPSNVALPDEPESFIKDPYVLEFLGLPESPVEHESKLEARIISKLQLFLLELGKGFSFVGRQFRVSSETSHYYIDLVFYNYLLKCFVLIDLKTARLRHQDIGQLDMYVRMFDDLKRSADDNPTIGIIFCADKDETEVRYSVLKESRQIFASKYRLVLPAEEELRAELDRRHILIADEWKEAGDGG